jgi:hypothetical protein
MLDRKVGSQALQSPLLLLRNTVSPSVLRMRRQYDDFHDGSCDRPVRTIR